MIETEWFEGKSTEPPRRLTVLAWWIWALVIVFAIALTLHAGQVVAGPVFKAQRENGSPIVLRLLDAPCAEAKVLAHLRDKVKPQLLPRFKAAALTWDGRVWASCWINLGGVIYSMDEEGAPLQGIPAELFRDDSV